MAGIGNEGKKWKGPIHGDVSNYEGDDEYVAKKGGEGGLSMDDILQAGMKSGFPGVPN